MLIEDERAGKCTLLTLFHCDIDVTLFNLYTYTVGGSNGVITYTAAYTVAIRKGHYHSREINLQGIKSKNK